MTQYHQALTKFWSQFTSGGEAVPAYLSGHVPDWAKFPYITFEVAMPDAMGSIPLTAFSWHQADKYSGVNVNAERAALLDQIAAAIPVEGVVLPVGNGFAVLQRNTANFQSYYDDPDPSSAIVGGRTSYIVRNYHM